MKMLSKHLRMTVFYEILMFDGRRQLNQEIKSTLYSSTSSFLKLTFNPVLCGFVTPQGNKDFTDKTVDSAMI